MKKIISTLSILALASLSSFAENPYLGHWGLTLPNGNAGWMGVAEQNGTVTANILWGGGSVKPANSTKIEGGKLVFTRMEKGRGLDKGLDITETITATRTGDVLNLVSVKSRPDGSEAAKAEFTGKRIPPLPAKPDLSALKFGDPVSLIKENSLEGWRLRHPSHPNGWSVKEGVLTNDAVQTPGEKKINYGNLRSDAEFEDFKLSLEVNVPAKSNSGIFIRGMYEVQVLDSFGKPVSAHNMGAVYSRITPSEAAEKPAGEWQTMEITLVDRHINVVLNGKTIVNNQGVEGCTGGALSSDPFKPGPLYLQGNHGSVSFRNMVLTPIKN